MQNKIINSRLVYQHPTVPSFQPDGKSLVAKLLVKYPLEVDVSQFQKILRSHWKAYLLEKPSLDMCKSLIMLRDTSISGRLNLLDIPLLMHMLQFWRVSSFCSKQQVSVSLIQKFINFLTSERGNVSCINRSVNLRNSITKHLYFVNNVGIMELFSFSPSPGRRRADAYLGS